MLSPFTSRTKLRFIKRKNLGPRSCVRQPEPSSFAIQNIENRVKQLRLGHAHKIYYYIQYNKVSCIFKKQF